MDVVLVGLLNVGVFMVLFVPFSQRLLGVRFGMGRLALGAALTLAVFTPLLNALAGPPPFEGSNGGGGFLPGVDRVVFDACRADLPGVVRSAGADRIVAQGP
jgi:ubiquinone biosynthesis protein